MGEHELFGALDPGDDRARVSALPLPQRLALAGLGFLAVAAVAVPVTLASGGTGARPLASPTASPLPTGLDVAVLSTETTDSMDALAVTVVNEGAAFRVVSARLEGPGYEPTEVGGLTGLGVADQARATVVLRPTCDAGLGVARRPELVLEVKAHDGTTRVLRTDLTSGVPPLLAGSCEAPLGTGARATVTPLPPDPDGSPRLRLTLEAGAGLLWLESIETGGPVGVQGLGGLPQVVAPGGSKAFDLQVQVFPPCEDLAPAGGPLPLRLRLRAEPPGEPRTVSLTDAGSRRHLRAVAAALVRACR